MNRDEMRATILSLKSYVEECEEKLRVVRLEMAATILELEEEPIEEKQRDERPLFLLNGGHVSRSVGADWANAGNYVGRLGQHGALLWKP